MLEPFNRNRWHLNTQKSRCSDYFCLHFLLFTYFQITKKQRDPHEYLQSKSKLSKNQRIILKLLSNIQGMDNEYLQTLEEHCMFIRVF